MKRKPVLMPISPPYEFLKWLAGDPLILAASDEQSLRYQYAQFRTALRDSMKAKKKGK